MSLIRSLSSLRKLERVCRQSGPTIQSVRNSGGLYSYRLGGYPPSKNNILAANVLGGFMWWWILWHCWHEPDHILGEFDFPDPSLWTNAELGIPPDDA